MAIFCRVIAWRFAVDSGYDVSYAEVSYAEVIVGCSGRSSWKRIWKEGIACSSSRLSDVEIRAFSGR